MWISNTATTAMLLPVALGLVATIERSIPGDDLEARDAARRYGSGMLLSLAYACSLGGMATPIGTAPNVIALDLLQRQAAITIDFFAWMSFALPTALACLIGLLAWIRVRYPPPVARIAGLAAMVVHQRELLGGLSPGGRRALVVLSAGSAFR